MRDSQIRFPAKPRLVFYGMRSKNEKILHETHPRIRSGVIARENCLNLIIEYTDNTKFKNDFERSLFYAISDTDCHVIAITGKWGVGKTHFWKAFIKSYGVMMNYRSYAYISLFGVKEIPEIEAGILSSSLLRDTNSTERRRFENIKDSFGEMKKLLASSSVRLSGIEAGPVIRHILNRSVKNQIICIDDIDRKESDLSASALLGLVSRLASDQNCKFVLILNDDIDSLDSKTRKTINDCREKVFDRELRFNPEWDDCLEWSGISKLSEDVQNAIIDSGNKNIRIMRQIVKGYEYFKTSLDGKYPNVSEKILPQVCRYIFAHYNPNVIYNASEARRTRSLIEKNPNGEESASLNRLMSELLASIDKDQSLPEYLNMLIETYLVDGYIDFRKSDQELAAVEATLSSWQVQLELTKFWQSFHREFSKDPSILADKVVDFIHKHYHEIHASDLYSARDLLERLGCEFPNESYLSESVDKLVDKLKGDRHADISRTIQNEDLRREVLRRLETVRELPRIDDLIDDLAGSNSWFEEDFFLLEKYSDEVIYEWATMPGEEPRDTINLIKRIFVRLPSPSTKGKKVYAKLKRVLERIAGESPRNERLVRNEIFEKILHRED